MSDLQFTIGRDAFADAVTWVARALPGRPLNPVLGAIRLTTDERGLLLQAFDYEVSASGSVPDAEVTIPGTVLVSGRLLQAVSKAFARKPVEFRAEGGTVHITCGAAKFTLPTLKADDFPNLPKQPAVAGEVDAALFGEAVTQTGFAVSRDPGAASAIKAVCFDFGPSGGVTLSATDRYRVAVRTIPWQPTLGDDPFPTVVRLLVPPRAIGDTGKLGGDTVQLGFEGDVPHMLGFVGENRRTITQLIGEEFPDLERVFPTEHTAVATVAAAELADLLGRALALDERDHPHVKMSFEPGVVHLSGGEAGVGDFTEDAAVDFGGDPIDVWLNPKYLLEGVTACRADKVAIGFTQPKKPLLLAPFDGEQVQNSGPYPALSGEFRYLLMPAQPPVGR